MAERVCGQRERLKNDSTFFGLGHMMVVSFIKSENKGGVGMS